MIIVYCIDRNYSYFAKVSIASYKKHNPSATIIVVSEEELPKDIGYDENVLIKLPKIFRNRGEGDRITNTAYLRLFLTQLPYDKVLYVDADTICQKPLNDLWNLNPKYIGVCESHDYGKKQAEDLGVKKYALSGMMLMNLKALRDIDFTTKCLEAEEKIPTPKTGWCHEETILNVVMKDKLTFLPLCFNYCHNRTYDHPINEEFAYILHYVGPDKYEMVQGVKYPELYILEDEIRNKRIAIVGNAKSIFDTKYGKEIDDHDFIIRFNHGVPKVEESQGTKTNMVMLACTLSDDEIKQYKAGYLVNRSGNYYNRLASFTIGNRERAIMASGIGAQPSTGFMAVNICLYFGAKSIDLYGFDWGNTKTFYNPEDYKTQHNYQKEKEIMIGYEVNGLINIKKGA